MAVYSNQEIKEIKQIASTWFANLRDQIRTELQKLEDNYNQKNNLPARSFELKSWDREGGGGGQISVLKGNLFEKIGVNISTVHGSFTPEMQKQIPGAEEDPTFFATGISLVGHPYSPMIPIVHMNTRFITTKNSWFGGGADLTPVFVIEKDKQDFHNKFKAACDSADPSYYQKFSKECDEYFFLKHRNESRGIGGIFYDYLNTGNFDNDFKFTCDVGLAFKEIYPEIVSRHMFEPFDETHKQKQFEKRGRYVEFNLIYDRGTKFGLMTGGNTEAIMMSLPPIATWA